MLNPLALRFQSDHLRRDPLDCLEQLGFHMEIAERARFGVLECVVARRP